MLATILVLVVVVGSLYALYRSVMKREDGYYGNWEGEYGDFDGPDEPSPDDYLTDSEWEEINSDPTYYQRKD